MDKASFTREYMEDFHDWNREKRSPVKYMEDTAKCTVKTVKDHPVISGLIGLALVSIPVIAICLVKGLKK